MWRLLVRGWNIRPTKLCRLHRNADKQGARKTTSNMLVLFHCSLRLLRHKSFPIAEVLHHDSRPRRNSASTTYGEKMYPKSKGTLHPYIGAPTIDWPHKPLHNATFPIDTCDALRCTASHQSFREIALPISIGFLSTSALLKPRMSQSLLSGQTLILVHCEQSQNQRFRFVRHDDPTLLQVYHINTAAGEAEARMANFTILMSKVLLRRKSLYY